MAADQAAYLVERIRDHLASDPRTNELEARITLAGEKLFISGIVPSEERRDAVRIVVQECVPDLDIVNQMTVADYPAAEDVEIVT